MLNDYSFMTDMTAEDYEIKAIKQLVKDWNAGWRANDVDALLDLYADDPILMPQNQHVIIGKSDIRSYYKSFFEIFTVSGESKFIEAEIDEDVAYLWDSYTLRATSIIGGEVIEDNGKAVFILKKQEDNAWKITRLIDKCDWDPAVI